MRSRKFPALLALLTLFAATMASAALADTTTITATVDSTTVTGTRVITSLPAVTLDTTITDGTGVGGPFSVSVEEVSALGTTWSVDASMTDLACSACTTSTPIPPDAVDFSGAAVTSTNLTLGTTTAANLPADGASMPLTADVTAGATPLTLWTVNGELADTYYTDLYAFTSTLVLTPPNGTVDGSYTGTITVTLNQ